MSILEVVSSLKICWPDIMLLYDDTVNGCSGEIIISISLNIRERPAPCHCGTKCH